MRSLTIDFTPLIEVISIFLTILFLPLLYIFLKNTLGEARGNYVWAGCWLFYLASWGGGPGNLTNTVGIAVIFFMVVLALVTSPRLRQKDTRSLVLLSLVVIAFAAMVTSHLLTSMAALGILVALSLVRRDRRLALAAVVCLAIWLAWNLTVAWDFMQYRIPFISGGSGGRFIFDLSVLTQSEVTSHFTGSSSHADVAGIKLIHGSLFALIVLAGLISALVKRRELGTTISLLAITVIPLSLVVLAGHYGREILTRIYAFVLPGAAYFGARLFDVNKKVVAAILCPLLIVAIPLNIIASYGNAELDYFSPGEQEGVFFFHDMTSQGLVFGRVPIGKFANIENYHTIGLKGLEWEDGRLIIAPRFRKMYSAYYVVISRQTRAKYEWFQGNPDLIPETEQQLQGAVNSNFIYNNPDLNLYIFER